MSYYYGSELANHAVMVYYRCCKRSGYHYDEPGANGVTLSVEQGRTVAEIKDRLGRIFRFVELDSGRLQRLQ